MYNIKKTLAVKKSIIITILLAVAFQARAYHWVVDPHLYPNTMTVTGAVWLDGGEQAVATLEVGAFCGEECRGRELPVYVPQLDRYLVFLTLYGEDGDTLSFRLYDHNLGEELNVTCLTTTVYAENGILGSPTDPYPFEFLSRYGITATANPEEGGTVEGAGTYDFGDTAILTATPNEGYAFINWTLDGTEVSTEVVYSFTVTEAGDYVANFELTAITEASDFSSGWTWWSTYIEQNGINGLDLLEEGLGNHGVTIKSQNNGFDSFMEGFGWYGSLDEINNESSYQVKVSESCVVEMTGAAANPADHPITLSTGWTWIGYPVSTSMSLVEALSGLSPVSGDMLKSQNNGFASYMEGLGWYGSLTMLNPGMGLMYKSNSSAPVTFTYPNGNAKDVGQKLNPTTEGNFWQPNLSAYSDNMSVMAVVELDGEELNSTNYELAAFANGECRGSARLMYVEPLNRYIAFLTVAGDEVADLYFALYDPETGIIETQCSVSLTYATNDVVGSFETPYVVRFHSTTGVYEWTSSLHIYPNPVERGQMISLGTADTEIGTAQIEIIDALGATVETRRATSLQDLTAPNVAGVYTLRITIEGKGTCYRKLVVR